jgi:hypothetical protein
VRPRATTALAIALVLGTGAAAAASGVSSMIVGGDDDGATAKSADQPLGTLSATPGPRLDSGENTGEIVVKGENGADDGIVKGADRIDAGGRGGPSGGGGGRLPFTGLMAIPLIGVGLGLIGSGLLLRRRERRLESA